MGLVCWKCGTSLRDVPRPLSRLSRCPECFSDLHCCRMCRKYAPQLIGRCSDERADPPENRQGANFCDWFSPHVGAFSGKEKTAEEKSREALMGLFGGPAESQAGQADADEARTASDRALEEVKKLFGQD